jgi:hypothetical protein
MTLRNLIVALIALTALAYGGTKAYLYYKIKHAWNDLAEMAAPFVEVKRGGITSSLTGAAGVTDVEIFLESGESIRIDRIEVLVPNIRYLLQADRALEQLAAGPAALNGASANMPKFVGINVSGVHIDLNSAYMQDFDQLARAGEDVAAAEAGCGDITHFGIAQMREMGYETVKLSVKTLVYPDLVAQSFRVKLDMAIAQMFRLDTDVSFDVPEANGYAMPMPRLAKLNMVYQDDSLQQRTSALCIKHGAPDLKAFRDGQLATFQAQMHQMGMELNPAMVSAYAKFLERPGSLTVSATPPSPVDMAGLKFYKASDIPALLNLSLTASP